MGTWLLSPEGEFVVRCGDNIFVILDEVSNTSRMGKEELTPHAEDDRGYSCSKVAGRDTH